MENRFLKKVQSASDKDLKYTLENKDLFQEELIEATIIEIENRGIEGAYTEELKNVQADKKAKRIEKEKASLEYSNFVSVIPKNIKLGSYLIFIQCLITVFETVYYNIQSGTSLGVGGLSIQIPTTVIILLFGILVYKGNSFIRHVYLILTVLGILIVSSAFSLTNLTLTFYLNAVLSIAALLYLYSKESRDWYKRKHELFENK